MDLAESRARALDAEDVEHSRRGDFLIPPAEGGPLPRSGLPGRQLARPTGARDPRAPRRGSQGLVLVGRRRSHRGAAALGELSRAAPRARGDGSSGALPSEVVSMNSLTVNLHLMMISFYRPTAERHAIVIEDTTFPSDSYAVRSQAAFHGFDPDTRRSCGSSPGPARTRCAARTSSRSWSARGTGWRWSCWAAVNYYSGEHLDMARSRRRGRRPAPSSAGIWRTRRATCRCACTTGASTGRPGAPTST